jgi:hypothetical protein
MGRQSGEAVQGVSPAAGRDVAVEHDEVWDVGAQAVGESVEVLAALGEDDRRPPVGEKGGHVSGDQLEATRIGREAE